MQARKVCVECTIEGTFDDIITVSSVRLSLYGGSVYGVLLVYCSVLYMSCKLYNASLSSETSSVRSSCVSNYLLSSFVSGGPKFCIAQLARSCPIRRHTEPNFHSHSNVILWLHPFPISSTMTILLLMAPATSTSTNNESEGAGGSISRVRSSEHISKEVELQDGKVVGMHFYEAKQVEQKGGEGGPLWILAIHNAEEDLCGSPVGLRV